ncbi:hypothetical protein MMC20_007619 [Loxospora ochrophaea]|nr:hypothetical protein [Loxospora ochrophaea]
MLSRALLSLRRLPHTPKPHSSFSHHSVVFVPPRITSQHRHYAAKSTVDEKIEELQELYATAKDEFEIASEETDKKTVYAADDRAAAQEELAKLKEVYEKAIGEEDGGEEIVRRVGQRVRELDAAVKAMEDRAMED